MCNSVHVFDCALVLELLHVSAFAHKPWLHLCGRLWVNQIQSKEDTCIPHSSASPFFGNGLWTDDPPSDAEVQQRLVESTPPSALLMLLSSNKTHSWRKQYPAVIKKRPFSQHEVAIKSTWPPNSVLFTQKTDKCAHIVQHGQFSLVIILTELLTMSTVLTMGSSCLA